MSQTSLARLRAYDGVSCEMIPYASELIQMLKDSSEDCLTK